MKWSKYSLLMEYDLLFISYNTVALCNILQAILGYEANKNETVGVKTNAAFSSGRPSRTIFWLERTF